MTGLAGLADATGITGTALSLLILMALLLIGSGLASGSETALFSLTHADRRAIEGRPGARAVGRLLARPRVLLLLVLVLNMTVNVAYFAAASVLSARAGGVAAAAVGAGSVLMIVLVGEVLAKVIARNTRQGFSRLVAPPLLAVRTLLEGPLTWLDALVLGPLARLIAPGARAPVPAAADELTALVELQSTRFTAEERRWLSRVLGLSDLRASAVMTPRVDLAWLDASAGIDETRAALAAAGHHQLAVCEGGPDSGIVGILDAKRYLAAAELRPSGPPPFSRYTRPPLFVPERARLDRVMVRFRDEGRSIAVCVDETGGVAGLIEIEDIVGAVLGQPARHTPADTEAASPPALRVRMAGADAWDLPARLGLHELAGMFEHVLDPETRGRIETAQADTVGGLGGELLGRVPQAGDEATLPALESGGIALRAVEVEGRAVQTVRLIIDPPAAPADGVAPGAEEDTDPGQGDERP